MALANDDPFAASPPLPHEQLRAAVTARRIRYLKAGHQPIPIRSGDKKPVHSDWGKMPIDLDVIPSWTDSHPGALSTGVRTKRGAGADIDVYDADIADQIEQALLNMIRPGTVLKRYGMTPKRLIPFRTDVPFKKISAAFRRPDDPPGAKAHKIEVLCDGQQFVVEGIHPDTHMPYRWADNVCLVDVARDHLPPLDEATARRFVDEATRIMLAAGYEQISGERPKTGGKANGKTRASPTSTRAADFNSIYYRSALKDECAALAAMPKDSGRNDALNTAAFSLFQLVAGGGLEENEVRDKLFAAAEACGLVADDGAQSVLATIESGAKAGSAQPRRAPDHNGGDEDAPDQNDDVPIVWINMCNWDHEPIPEREWAIFNRVPLKQAGLFSGEGGTGKSIMELTKDVAHVAARDWFGSMPAHGPAIYVGAEDDEKEIHIRLAAIAKHYGVTFEQLIAGGLHALCLLGQDATLCAATGKSGKVEVTGLYRRLYQAAGDIKPKNISIDTLSRAFAGSEIDRVQVYAFAMHMQALAMAANGSVTVLSHPSLQGIASGSGISGSTAWHGAFRFRQYLKGIRPDSGEHPDDDLRELQFKKNQYGPTGETIVARYQGGLFLPVAGMTSIERAAHEAKAEEIFLELLRSLAGQNRYVSDKTSTNYAPAVFAKEGLAQKADMTSKILAAAMQRLFTAGKIWNEQSGRPSRPSYRIALKPRE
jgi:RecA-family ATPase